VQDTKITGTVAAAMARGLSNAGVKVATYVPGSGANEVFAEFNRLVGTSLPVSFNEEVAYSIAHGASLAGARSVSLMKAHGLIKAGNSVSDSLYCGTGAGLGVMVFEDKGGKQSDSILDIEEFIKGIGIPFLRAELKDLSRQIGRLYDESEKRSLPCVLIVESSLVEEKVEMEEQTPVARTGIVPQRDIARHVLCPFFADYQKKVLTRKKNREDWSAIERPAFPTLPGSLPPKWIPVVREYAELCSVFKSIRGPWVSGDTGVSSLFALEPYGCIDVTTCMGGSVPLAVGASLAGYSEAWALTGDFAFIAAGHMGLIEAWQRQVPLKLLIFYNGKAETTGGQAIPPGTLERLLSGYQDRVEYISNPSDHREAEQALKRAKISAGLRIVVADYRDQRSRPAI
jgi:TPP-dependent indolepyruvate ferredoxin oxidoreductase alpha subunit